MNDIEHIAGVLVIGAGYAGLHAARTARAAGAPVTIVDPVGVHGFTTRLAAVAGGTSPEGDAFAPLEAFGHSIRRGRIVGLEDGVVRLDDGAVLTADAVVVTAGARATSPGIPGFESAVPLRTPSDAIRLRRRLETAETVSIIGGGATGVQLAGAAAATHSGLTVRLIDREPILLTGLGQSLSDRAEQILSSRGVQLLLEHELDRLEPDGLTLSNGRSFEGLVVWAGGFESVVDELGDELPRDEGRISVGSDLRIAGWERTFAAGDVAAHRTAAGELLPMAAQIAVQAGDAAGKGAARLINGSDPTPASLSHRGWVIDLGGSQGVAKIGPVPLAMPGLDRLPPLLHHVIDVKHLLEVGGLDAAGRFGPGRHRPGATMLDRLLSDDRMITANRVR